MKKISFFKHFIAMLTICSFLVVMLPTTVTKAASYENWKQYDSAWGSKPLGNNGTMASWGCKITSIAILMVHSGAESESNFNPGILRDRYENAGYISHSSSISADGNLLSGATSQSFQPNFYYVGSKDYNPTPFSQICPSIKSLLNQGYYVEVRVKNNGHSVAVKSATDNEVYIMDPGYNRTTLSSYDGGISSCNYYRANKVNTPQNDSIVSSGLNYPSTLKVGQAFSVTGTVTSSASNITSLTAGVYSGNSMVTGKTVYPNARSYNMSGVDPYIYFNNLSAGTYTYRVTATNASGTTQLLNRTFTVGSTSDVLSASGYNYPTSLRKGQAYSIYGTVTSSSSNIKSLTCGVYTTGGSLVTGKTVYPNAKSYNLKNVDAYVYFNNLGTGTYYYKVTATNSAGSKVVINQRFTVS